MESVAALPWNQWQDSPGIGGIFGVEYAQVVLLNVDRTLRFSHDVGPSVPARRGRHWQQWGLKHAVGAGKPSRTMDRLRGMTG
jgi:hypothetical protein